MSDPMFNRTREDRRQDRIEKNFEFSEKLMIKSLFENEGIIKAFIEKELPAFTAINPSADKTFNIFKRHYKRTGNIINIEALKNTGGFESDDIEYFNECLDIDYVTTGDRQTELINVYINPYMKDAQQKHYAMKQTDAISNNDQQKILEMAQKMVEVSSFEISGGNGFEIKSMYDIAKKEFTDQFFIVPGLLPIGLLMISGKPKRGKSWIILGEHLTLGTGGLLFGKYRVEPTENLYLCLEDPEQRMKQRINQLMPGAEIPKISYCENRVPRLDNGLIPYLERYLKEKPGIKLISIDTLEKVAPEFDQQKGNSTDYSKNYKKLDTLKRLADDHKLCIQLVNHLNKRDTSDPVDRIMGSTALTAAVDTIMVLDKKVKHADGKLFIQGRDIIDHELAMNFDNSTGWWSVLGDADEYDKTAVQAAILNLLPESPDKIKTADIIVMLSDFTESNIKVSLKRMYEKDLINRPTYGYYCKI